MSYKYNKNRIGIIVFRILLKFLIVYAFYFKIILEFYNPRIKKKNYHYNKIINYIYFKRYVINYKKSYSFLFSVL